MKKTYISPVAREIALESEVVMQVTSNMSLDDTLVDPNEQFAPVRLDIFNYGGLTNSGLGGE